MFLSTEMNSRALFAVEGAAVGGSPPTQDRSSRNSGLIGGLPPEGARSSGLRPGLGIAAVAAVPGRIAGERRQLCRWDT